MYASVFFAHLKTIYMQSHQVFIFTIGVITTILIYFIFKPGIKKINELPKKNNYLFLGSVDYDKYDAIASIVQLDQTKKPMEGKRPFNVIISKAQLRSIHHGSFIDSELGIGLISIM
jgi:hypothetical protein